MHAVVTPFPAMLNRSCLNAPSVVAGVDSGLLLCPSARTRERVHASTYLNGAFFLFGGI